ncbi:MAG: hypothetical protein AB7H66_00895 [Hyphomonadaceae bacterium]
MALLKRARLGGEFINDFAPWIVRARCFERFAVMLNLAAGAHWRQLQRPKQDLAKLADVRVAGHFAQVSPRGQA